MRGIGECKFYDGSTYKGDYNCSSKHGFGKYTWISGDEYEGEWMTDLMHGTGILNF